MTRETSTKQMPSYKGALNNGNAAETFRRNVTLSTTNTIEYKFDLMNRHNFTVLAGQGGYYKCLHNFSAYSGGLI